MASSFARVTQKKLNELGTEVPPHSPYSPQLSPTDFHFFKHLDNFVKEEVLKSEEEVRDAFEAFVSSRTPDFYDEGINKVKVLLTEVFGFKWLLF